MDYIAIESVVPFYIATIKLIGMPFFRCFSRDSVEGILAALEAEGNDWGNKYLEVRLANSLLHSY